MLVGTTLAILSGTGMLKTSENAANQYEYSQEEDVVSVAFSTVFSKSMLTDEEITVEALQKELDKSGQKTTVTKDVDDENILNIRFDKTENEHSVNIDTGEITYDGTYSGEAEDNLAQAKIQMTASPTTPTNGNVTVTIRPGAGVDVSKLTLEYRIGTTGQWTQYKEALTITKNLTVWARFRYINQVTEYSSLTITNIDKLIPVVTAVTTTTNKITFSAHDPAKTADYNCSQINAYAVTTSNTAPALNATGGTEGNAGEPEQD